MPLVSVAPFYVEAVAVRVRAQNVGVKVAVAKNAQYAVRVVRAAVFRFVYRVRQYVLVVAFLVARRKLLGGKRTRVVAALLVVLSMVAMVSVLKVAA